MTGITYDTGVLIAAERGDRRVWALHRRSLERGMVPLDEARGDLVLSSDGRDLAGLRDALDVAVRLRIL